MSTTGSLPPLPQIDNRDLLLEVCTHKDLRPRYRDEPCEWGDSERLADMGFRILELVVTSSLFSKRPIILAEELRVHFATLFNGSPFDFICYVDIQGALDLASHAQLLDKLLPAEAEVACTS